VSGFYLTPVPLEFPGTSGDSFEKDRDNPLKITRAPAPNNKLPP
jgi:hypothetical protein